MREIEKIEKGNIILINVNDTEPSMAIIPKIDFQECKISHIFRKIHKLTKQFPNCNFNNCSFLYENKYDLLSYKRNISLSKWFQHYNIQKDEYNNYIFYITPFHIKDAKKQNKKKTNRNNHKKKNSNKKELNKTKKTKII